jgi:hypothetical protein
VAGGGEKVLKLLDGDRVYLWVGKTGQAYSFGSPAPRFHVMTFVLLILGLAVVGAPHFGRETRPEWLDTPRAGLTL